MEVRRSYNWRIFPLQLLVASVFIKYSQAAVTWNAPLNGAGNYVKAIDENVATGGTVVTASATNTGTETVRYRLEVTSAVKDGLFSINKNTGVISYNPGFNFENAALPATNPKYTLRVHAFTGITADNIQKTIEININDLAENPFINDQPRCYSLYENIGGGTLFSIDANDQDAADTPDTIDYELGRFEPASGSGRFSVNQFVLPNLATKKQFRQNGGFNFDGITGVTNYNVSYRVKDTTTPTALYSADWQRVQVQILNVNEPPSFAAAERTQTASFFENMPVGTVVFSSKYPLRATDPDYQTGQYCKGDTSLPDKIEYFCEGKFSEYFHVVTFFDSAGHQDGRITSIKSLTSDPYNPVRGTFNWYCYARDSHGIRNNEGDKVTISVTVKDVNDHPTVCTQSSFSVTVTENTVFNTNILTMTCTDDDDTATHPISFSIADVHKDADAALAEKYFGFDAVTGEMKTKVDLALEGGKTFGFKVLVKQGEAKDETTVTLSVSVTIVGVNDQVPDFTKLLYVFRTPHNIPSGAVIGTISATDGDSPLDSLSYHAVWREYGIMLGTQSGHVYADYSGTDDEELYKFHRYWVSAQVSDGKYTSKYCYIRVDTYDEDTVMIKIEVAVEYSHMTDPFVADLETKFSRICTPCVFKCPKKQANNQNTILSCYALKDSTTFFVQNKEKSAEFLTVDYLMEAMTEEKNKHTGAIWEYAGVDIVSVTPFAESTDLLPLWIVLGILGFIGLLCGLTYAIKACISHGMCKPCNCKKPPKPTKTLHPESYGVDTFNFNYMEHDKGPI